MKLAIHRMPAAHRMRAWLRAAWLVFRGTDWTRPVSVAAAAVARRWQQVRQTPDRGLTTVEVAVLAAVLLGLATALLVAISAVVNKHIEQIK